MAVFNEALASVESSIVLGVLITGVSFIGKQKASLCQYMKGRKKPTCNSSQAPRTFNEAVSGQEENYQVISPHLFLSAMEKSL